LVELGLPVVRIFGIDTVSFMLGMGMFYGICLIITLSMISELGYTGIPNFGKLLFIASGSAVVSSLAGRLAVHLMNINRVEHLVVGIALMSSFI
jgi:ABC-type branched-subunit amino acid transport system permease subunit